MKVINRQRRGFSAFARHASLRLKTLHYWHTRYQDTKGEDARRLGVMDGDMLRVTSRRGEVAVPAEVTDRVAAGMLFMPFHFREALANLLTNDALDPVAKIPELKVCAVNLSRV